MPNGEKPILPRKSLLRQETTAALKNTAWQIGMVVVVERHRKRWTQEELARQAGVTQGVVSAIERGKSVPRATTDEQIEKVFEKVGVPSGVRWFNRQIAFIKYWRDMDFRK